MAGGKETPRQKMIGMMYLVLTALLALNVSKEIINAFVKLDQKLMESNALLINQSDEIMLEFENAMLLKQNKPSVKPYYDKAIKVREMTFEIDKFINMDCKNELIKSVESVDWITVDEKNKRFKTRNPMEIETKDDYDAATRLFGGEMGTEGFERGAGIRNRIHQYRDQLLSFISEYEYGGKKYRFDPSKVDQSDSTKLLASLEVELKRSVFDQDREKVRAIYKLLTLPEHIQDNEDLVAWQLGTFDHAPVVAASAMFTAFSNDIRNAEMKALELLRSKINVEMTKVNKIEILPYARTNYMNMGDSMDLSVMLAAFDTTDVPLIRYGIDGDTVNEANWREINGKIKLNGDRSGMHKIKGVMGVKIKGELNWRPWEFAYEVGQPTSVISNAELNILYAEWDNKIEATASGYPPDKISLSGDVAATRSGDMYLIRPAKSMAGRTITLRITGKNADGSTKQLGTKQFKIKKMPVPMVWVGQANNMHQGPVDKVKLVQGKVTASYDPNNTILNCSFTVTGFTMTVMKDGISKPYTSATNDLTAAMKDMLQKLPSGSMVSFTNVMVSGPNGSKFAGPNCSFILK